MGALLMMMRTLPRLGLINIDDVGGFRVRTECEPSHAGPWRSTDLSERIGNSSERLDGVGEFGIPHSEFGIRNSDRQD